MRGKRGAKRGEAASKRALVAGLLVATSVLVSAGIGASGAGAATDITVPGGLGVPIAKGAACLPGTWSLNLPNSPAGLTGNTTTSEGAVTLQIGPGRKLVETFGSVISTGQPGPGGKYLQTREETTGTVTADWTATVHKLTLRHIQNATSSTSTVQIDDRTSDPATETPAPQTFKGKRQTVAYRCSGDTLSIATVGGIKQGFTRTG